MSTASQWALLVTLAVLVAMGPRPTSSGIAVTTERVLSFFDSSPNSRQADKSADTDVKVEPIGAADLPHLSLDSDDPELWASPAADFTDYNFAGRYRALRAQMDKAAPAGERARKQGPEHPSPVVLVPGYGGSRLEARRHKAHVKHYFCDKQTDWSNIWIDLKLMLPYMIDCLIEDFRLEFDVNTNTTHNTEGVEIRVRDSDNLANVEYLTDIHLSSFGYFAAIIRRLTHAHGYLRNANIRGEPYDFRKAPNELADYFLKMRQTSEQLFEQFKRPVSFVCHSMGCNNVLYFLQQQTAQWKAQHVARLISLAAPWGGSMQAVRATAFGDNLGMPYLFDEAELKVVQQSVPSTMYLFPSERVFPDTALIKTHTNGSASAADLKDQVLRAHNFKPFFDKINHPSGYLMWLNTKDLLRQVQAPGVEVWCLYGKGRPTLARMEFAGDFPDSEERDIYEDGDGTVSVMSASFCQQWRKEQKQPVYIKSFFANHVEMMKDTDVLDAIERIMSTNQV